MTPAPQPPGQNVVLTVTHRHGDDITVHADRAEAMKELAAFARRWWHQIPAVPGGPPQDDAETIRIYFARQPDEYWDITEVPVALVDCDDDVALVPRVVIVAMDAIVDHSWQSEQRDYGECGDPPRGNGNSREDHVFRLLQLFRYWLDLTAGRPGRHHRPHEAAGNAPMSALDDGPATIRLAPHPVPRGPGRPADREILDYTDADHPRVLTVVPNRYSYSVLGALRAAYRAGQANTDTDPRYDDPRWWTSTCSRCGGTEFHTADCREAESVECEHCTVAVVAYKAEAATEPGWWHGPACPLFASREPDTEVAIEVQGKLTKAQFRFVFELLGRPPDRYKEWCSGPYHFGSSATYGPLTVELADAVCAYLQDIGVPYERQTATKWRP